ncbi:MAG TPA: DUF4142 domain-containing protein [Burkholderiaceae bacterium]|nr:DUF4142 domain-containing protein [Burkholderiaceae bacterium]
MAGMAEVEAGRVASQKATNPQVKEFAQKMVDDHTTGNSELMKLASARNIAPPEGPDKAHRAMLVKMEKMSGPEFDRAYMKQQVADHEKTVNLFERQSKNGKDPELRDFAAKQLPIMREHLKMAQMMQRGGDMSKGGMQHGGSTAGGSSSGGSAAGASAAGASATGGGMATGSASRSNPAPTGGAMGGTMGGNAGGPPGSGMTGTPGSPSGTAGGGMGGASGSGMGGGTGGSGAGGASGAGGGSR